MLGLKACASTGGLTAAKATCDPSTPEAYLRLKPDVNGGRRGEGSFAAGSPR